MDLAHSSGESSEPAFVFPSLLLSALMVMFPLLPIIIVALFMYALVTSFTTFTEMAPPIPNLPELKPDAELTSDALS